MRRRIITGSPVNFDEFFIPFTTTFSINWEYSQEGVLSQDPDDPSAVKMNPAFERHIRELQNWTLGSRFRDTFPELVDQEVGIRDVAR